tara:strand:+ start:176 stop:1108 length:933 start_codon:yes stop_codon:yes gene_type:complete
MTKNCAALYNHTNIRGGNRVYPCCRYKSPLQTFDGDVDNILHSKAYEELRDTFTLDNPNCAKCKHEELLGKESLREWFNKNYSIDQVKLKYLEIGFDNICDLACDGCWEEWSSTWWAKKNPDLPAKQGITSTHELTNIPSTITKLVFLGGEPLMTNRHRQLLESIPDLSNVEIEYFTNGMHKLTHRDYVLYQQCKRVHFTVSIDGYKDLNERVRSGSKWNNIESFLYDIKDNFDYTVHTTIHKNNWHGLPALADWVEFNNHRWTTNLLTFPKELDIINLEQCDKRTLLVILDEHNIPNNNYIQSHLQGEA